MIKFHEIGMYKNAVNIGYCVATEEMHNGQAAIFDVAAKTASHPATGKEEDLAIVMNSIEKPEVHAPNKYVIEEGDFPRLFTLESLKNRLLDMDTDQVVTEYSSISEKDKLVAKTDGTWEKNEATGYGVYLEVIEKTGFNGEGLLVAVRIQTPAGE